MVVRKALADTDLKARFGSFKSWEACILRDLVFNLPFPPRNKLSAIYPVQP
jgi:hypothetical protein